MKTDTTAMPEERTTSENNVTDIAGKRLLMLCHTTGYQARAFAAAAERLGLDVVFGTDRCHVLDDPWRDGALPLRFEKTHESVRQVLDYALQHGVDAVVSLGDRPTPVAARVCRELELPGHPPWAAEVCRDKYRSREALRSAGLNVPAFVRFPVDADPKRIFGSAPSAVNPIGYPCVLKPLALSGSRGVIRANHAGEAVAAFERIRALLRSPEVEVLREGSSDFIQAEAYVEGTEVAVEGAMDRGRMHALAIFDKPDPLEGPYFEETIYVTPSRLPQAEQRELLATLERAVRALGLWHGPFHAELRLNARGVWPLEIAARPIGGLCARALRFRLPGVDQPASLEELVIRLALGQPLDGVERERPASGVMMIPVSEAGIYLETMGVDEAATVPGVEAVEVTAKPQQRLSPLPEGAAYMGFIFARAERPEQVEAALRAAHGKLRFVVARSLTVI